MRRCADAGSASRPVTRSRRGVIGSSIAYHVARQGRTVLVVERHEVAVSPAASWASAGGVRPQGLDWAEAALARAVERLIAVVVILLALPGSHEQPVAAANIQISAAQFAAYIHDWSEPEGYFDSDNFISNETSKWAERR